MIIQRSPQLQQGSFIIEAVISLLILGIAIIGLLGLVGSSLNAVGQSKARNDIGYLAGELIAEMWVSSVVDITAWSTRLAAAMPGAVGKVYTTNCACSLTGLTYGCTGQTAATGSSVPVAKVQPVTVCVIWSDKADQHLYQTSSLISRN